ncbi:ATP-binding protein [Aquiflexum sp.]|uniref:tetratricopeptide repeat-containing sensor histidine kinase n=1 Tax=Aquiflexum sp. TaxID=1872584 RepID=UPI003592EDB1
MVGQFFFLNILGCLFFLASYVSAQENWQNLDFESIYKLADKNTDQFQYAEAKEKLDFLLTKQDQLNPDLIWKCNSLLGYTYYFLGDFTQSNTHYSAALEMEKSSKDTSRMINTNKAIGMNYRKMGLFGISLQQYQKALTLTQNFSQGKYHLSNLYNSISLLYNSQNDFVKSLEYSKEAIELAAQNNDTTLMAFAYTNASLAFHNLGQFDSSIIYNSKSLELKKSLGNFGSPASNFNNMGLDYLKMMDFVKANVFFDSAKYWFQKTQFKEGMIIIHNNYGSLFLQQNQLKTAKSHLDTAYLLLQNLENKNLLAENLETQVELYSKLNDFKKAFEIQTDLVALKNDLFQTEVLQTKQFESAYLLSEKEKEKQILQLDATLAQQKQKQYSQFFTLATIIAVLLLILSTIYFSLSRQLKSKNNLIEIQKTDIIHRTNNILAKVQATLKIIANGFPNNAEKEKLQLAESVIISAGKLQEFTYTAANQTGKVVMDHYIKSLTKNIFETFAPKDQEIFYRLQLEEGILIPEEQGMNIGIIYSELVLNAIKYAFGNHQTPNPEISVALKIHREKLKLEVQDNGRGLPKDLKQGTGLEMVHKLAKQIRANLNISSDVTGTKFELIINRL